MWSRAIAARRGTRRRYPIYPRFRYQSPTKGDATTRRASATRSHEPSRGTKLLGLPPFRPSPMYSRSRVPSLSSSSSFVSQPTPPPSFAAVPRHSTLPRARRLLLHTLDRARTRAWHTHAEPTPHALVGERAHARPREYAAVQLLANDRCIYLFSLFQFSIAKSPDELLD